MAADVDAHTGFDEVIAIVLAAGEGSRLGAARPKAFVGLGGRVLLAHSVEAFECHEAVDGIVLVVPEDWTGPAEVLVDDLGFDRVSAIEVGGACRAESVLRGLTAVRDRPQTAVLVHDAARPVVPNDLVDRVLRGLDDGYDAVVPTLPVTDTVKQIESDGRVVTTIARNGVRLAQTPQGCRASVLRSALQGAEAAGSLERITDCAQAIEEAGGRVLTVDGDERALKVTVPDDLAVVTAWLEESR